MREYNCRPTRRHAFKVACGFARDYNVKLIVLGVIAHSRQMGAFAGFGTEAVDEQSSLARALAAIEPTNQGIVLERVVIEDESAARAIARMASDRDCDLIVMGSHGRTGIEWLVFGSMAEEVMRKAPCSVLAIRDASRWLKGSSPGNELAAGSSVADERTSCA